MLYSYNLLNVKINIIYQDFVIALELFGAVLALLVRLVLPGAALAHRHRVRHH